MPCADGKDRVRMHGGSYLVISYRDSPAYAEGRERWAAYQSEVLKARAGPRAPSARPGAGRQRTARGSSSARSTSVVDVVDFFDPDSSNEPSFDPPRYCWPPAV